MFSASVWNGDVKLRHCASAVHPRRTHVALSQWACLKTIGSGQVQPAHDGVQLHREHVTVTVAGGQVKAGTLGTLKIHLPWTNLSNEGCSVTLCSP